MNTVENWDIRNCKQNDKEGGMAFHITQQKKLNGRGFKQLLRSKVKKAKGSDLSNEKKSEPSQTKVKVTEPNSLNEDEKANADDCLSHSRRERLDFLLRRVKAVGIAKRSNSSNLSTQTKKKKRILCNLDKPKLEKEFESCDAYMCKSTKPNFVEYWVPVGFSEMQIEQYCGTLFSKADILCSCSKHDPTEVLNDIIVSLLVSTKKCCDHPYLVDGSLSTFLVRDIPKPELLDAELKMSNKLLLLHKILLEIRKRGLRVLILYQSLGESKLFTTGDLLDEIIHQTFGTDLFVRVGGRRRISRSKRQAALNTFNDKENGKFICLMETDSCVPSIKLASIDTVIFFNSDWNPMNDLKALQKIDLDSQFEHVKVFRLYSSHTLEEKLLILAKQGITLESHVLDIKQSTCHQLLSWGASHLFEKLDEFHDGKSVISDEDSLEDVFLELSNLLPNNENSTVCSNKKSCIVEVQQIGGIYPTNISLLGEAEKISLMDNDHLIEKMIHKEPNVFWTKLLEGRDPRWKYFSNRPRRLKKGIKRFDDLLDEPAFNKRRKEARSTVYQIPVNIRRRIRSKLQNRQKRRKLSGGEKCDLVPLVEGSIRQLEHVVPQQTVQLASPMREDRREPSAINEAPVSLTPDNSEPPAASCVTLQSVCQVLRVELEGLQKQKTELLKLHEEKKLQTKMACEKEIDQIRKKYDMLLQNAETALLEEKQVIEKKYNKIYINKSLAEAVMERDSTEKQTFPQVTTNCSIKEMYQLFFGSNTDTKPEQVAKSLLIPSQPVAQAQGSNHESTSDRITSRPYKYCKESFPTLGNPATSSNMASYIPTGQMGFNRTNQAAIATRLNHILPPLVQVPQTLVGFPPVSPMTIVPYNFSGNVAAGYRARAPAPHFRHPQPITGPKMSYPGPGFFSPVSLQPVTPNLQTVGSNLWTLSCVAGLPL